MPQEDLVTRYNYEAYVPEKFQPWLRFAESPVLGRPAPDFPLQHLDDGSQVYLTDVWAKHLYTVVEFGCFTCPSCGIGASAMNRIAEAYADNDVGSIFIYTHEAHPGELYPHHQSMDDKVKHAEALRDVLGVKRPILLDSLDGSCHRAYGSMPNMTWIFTRQGVPIYKASWSDAGSVDNALAYSLGVIRRRRERERLSGFHVERADYRPVDQNAFYAALARNGPKAVAEYDVLYRAGALPLKPEDED